MGDSRVHFLFSASDEFRLEVPREHPYGRGKVLYRNGKPESGVHARALDVLLYLIENRKRQPTEDEIYSSLWLTDNKDQGLNVQTHVSKLRRVFAENSNDRNVIEGSPASGYRFLPDVARQGDPMGKVDAWSSTEFEAFIHSTQTGPPTELADLRLAVTSFEGGVPTLKFRRLLERGVRVAIILTDPESGELLVARNRLRKFSAQRHKAQIEEQIADLLEIKKDFPQLLLIKVSKAMPAGFVTINSYGAYCGMFLAYGSYIEGPMTVVPPATELWRALMKDWQLRWDDPDASLIDNEN